MKKILHLFALLLGVLMLPATTLAQNNQGDVNCDGEVNIADVNTVIAVIMSSENSPLADVNSDGEINVADVNVLIDIILNGNVQPEPEPDYVDLGLPSGTLWATRNVGAACPEDYGDYFAWGETAPKEKYAWSNYSLCDGNEWSMTKYDPSAFWRHDELELEPIDDAATVNWGPSWCMPSEGQVVELINNCSWQFTEKNGVNGSLVTGPNGNTIFLPAAGYRSNSSLSRAGTSGFYWSSTVKYNEEKYAFYLNCYSNAAHSMAYYPGRCTGFTVRPVRVPTADEPPLYIAQRSLELGEVPIGVTRTDELTIINNTDEDLTLTVTVDEPFSLKEEDGSTMSMTIEVPTGTIAPVTVEFFADDQGDFNGHVTFQSPAFAGGEKVIPVQARAINDVEQHQYVDLGLPSHTLWATCNIGASSPEECGDYFAWGETKPKDYYAWSSYKWNMSTTTGYELTKYCLEDLYGCGGFVDGKEELDPADDAAYVNWGPQWRMPTMEQFEEMYDNCALAWLQQNGVYGMLFTGPNGNSMFLPVTGLRVGCERYYANMEGMAWSRTCEDDSRYAIYLSYYSEDWYLFFGKRCYGLPVRPVRASN